MKNISRIAASALVALSVTAVAASASATNRHHPVCEGRDARSLASGEIIGATIVDQAWASVGQNPDEIDTFRRSLKRIVRGVVRSTVRGGASSFVKCRAQGLVNGVKRRLQELQDEVRNLCIVDGEFWGELSAELYCELASAFDGLEFLDLTFPELQEATCGQAFEESCQETFAVTAEYFCHAYTVHQYVAGYTENQRLACTYEF